MVCAVEGRVRPAGPAVAWLSLRTCSDSSAASRAVPWSSCDAPPWCCVWPVIQVLLDRQSRVRVVLDHGIAFHERVLDGHGSADRSRRVRCTGTACRPLAIFTLCHSAAASIITPRSHPYWRGSCRVRLAARAVGPPRLEPLLPSMPDFALRPSPFVPREQIQLFPRRCGCHSGKTSPSTTLQRAGAPGRRPSDGVQPPLPPEDWT
jgi:hypothetical protein